MAPENSEHAKARASINEALTSNNNYVPGLSITDQVAVHFFHKNSEEAAADRMTSELAACLRVHRGLHASCVVDDEDLRHIVRLRDVLVCAPILDDAVYPAQPSSGDPMFRATVMVFDWNDGGDAHTFMLNRGGVDQVRAVGVFRHLLRGLRALHRRGIVHRNIKVRVVLVGDNIRPAHGKYRLLLSGPAFSF